MKNNLFIDKNNFPDSLQVSGFGYELIREVLIPELLGNDLPPLLYWAGKVLARKYPLQSIEEIISFFEYASWGTLAVSHEKRNEVEFSLISELISHRLQVKDSCSFQLEGGFLAQQIQQQTKKHTEAYEQQKKRVKKIIFTVKWDNKDPIE